MNNKWKQTYAVLWTGQAFSIISSSVVQYAIMWHLAAQTKSPALLAVATGACFLPRALFGSWFGAVADRFERKKLMILADLFVAAATLVLAAAGFWAGSPGVPLVITVLFFRSVGSGLHEPCLQAVTPQIVPEEYLTKCNGYTQAVMSISYLASPALAAILFAVWKLPLIILLDVAGALLGCLAVAAARIPPLLTAADGEKKRLPHLYHDTLKSITLLTKMKGIRILVLSGFFFSFVFIPLSSFYPLMCLGYFGKTTAEAALVETVFTLCMMGGGLIIGVWGGFKNRVFMLAIVLGIFALLCGGIGFLPPTAAGFGLFIVLSGGLGFFSPFYNAPCMALFQTKTAPEELGRVMGVSGSVMSAASLAGLGIFGAMAEKTGMSSIFIFAGAVMLATVLLFAVPREMRDMR